MPLMRTSGAGGGVTQSIMHSLGVRIVTGGFTGKAFPTEIALCVEYGAARTVMREAIKMLTAKGLITSRPRQGISVAPEDNWNLLDPDVLNWLLARNFSLPLLIDFTQIRLIVEPGAAALAAVAATTSDKEAIRQAVKRMYAAERGEDDPLASDIDFHVSVLHASNNRFFRQMREMIATALQVSIMRTNELKGVKLASARDHDRVAKHILAGSPKEASDAMHALILGALKLITRVKR
jgi:DNA-binding FadR family transcriptional regulator